MKPDRLRDRLERVVAGLADDDVVGVGLGHDEAGLVQGGREPRLADHERRCRPASGCWRKSAVASADVQIESSGTISPDARSRALRSRGVKIELFVSTRNGRALVAPLLQQLGGAGDRGVLMDEHAVHVGQPAFDVGAGPHVPSLAIAGGAARRRVGVVPRAEQRWDPQQLPDLTGRTYLVTGSNAGLGYFASEQLVRAGAAGRHDRPQPEPARRQRVPRSTGGIRMPRPPRSRRSCSTRATSGRCARPLRASQVRGSAGRGAAQRRDRASAEDIARPPSTGTRSCSRRMCSAISRSPGSC